MILRIAVLILLSFGLCAQAYALTARIDQPLAQAAITDDQLRQLAISKGIIPEDEKVDFYKEIEEGNTIVMWILMPEEEKLAVVEGLKAKFKQEDIAITNPSSYYVSEINGIIYKSIVTGDISSTNKKGLGVIFKTVALMDGDFQDGKNKLRSLQDYIGEEKFEEFRRLYPDKYQRLLEMDE